MRSNPRLSRKLLAVALAIMSVLLAIVPAHAEGGPGGIIPPQARVEGRTYGQWSALWWQWLYSIPWANSPVNDPTGANCGQGQHGQVWFLAETWIPNNTTNTFDFTRDCTIPAGKMLFVALLNAENSLPEAATLPQWDGTWSGGPNSLAGITQGWMDSASVARLTIDGRVFDVLHQPPFRVQAGYDQGSATYTLAPDNILGLPAGTYPFFADGYYVMLAPLSAGDHTLILQGANPGFQTTIT